MHYMRYEIETKTEDRLAIVHLDQRLEELKFEGTSGALAISKAIKDRMFDGVEAVFIENNLAYSFAIKVGKLFDFAAKVAELEETVKILTSNIIVPKLKLCSK